LRSFKIIRPATITSRNIRTGGAVNQVRDGMVQGQQMGLANIHNNYVRLFADFQRADSRPRPIAFAPRWSPALKRTGIQDVGSRFLTLWSLASRPSPEKDLIVIAGTPSVPKPTPTCA
jgi:hypothetical protein